MWTLIVEGEVFLVDVGDRDCSTVHLDRRGLAGRDPIGRYGVNIRHSGTAFGAVVTGRQAANRPTRSAFSIEPPMMKA